MGWIALGSNLGDRLRTLEDALTLLAAEGIVPGPLSSAWETEPVGIPGPQWVLNAVAGVRSTRSIDETFATMLHIETRFGRERSPRLGGRTLDLDLLLFGEERVRRRQLEVPHPRMAERRFVLAPLAEIAPDLVLAGLGLTAREALARLPEGPRVRRVAILALPGTHPVYSGPP